MTAMADRTETEKQTAIELPVQTTNSSGIPRQGVSISEGNGLIEYNDRTQKVPSQARQTKIILSSKGLSLKHTKSAENPRNVAKSDLNNHLMRKRKSSE